MPSCQNILLLFFTVSAISLQAQPDFKKTGIASFYHDKFEGRKTSSGEKFRQKKMTCAHRTLPFGTKLLVTNLSNDKTVTVTVNDRGPFSKGRIIDLTRAAAKKLDFINSGHTKVSIEIIEETVPDEKDTVESYALIDPSKSTHTGFSIQVGYFAEKENMLRMVEKMKSEVKEEVFVWEKKEHKTLRGYHVLVGVFPTRGEAFGFLNKIFNKYPEAFILELK